MNDTILITGASGFIGQALKRSLSSEKKTRVIGISRSGRGCLRVDLLDTPSLKRLLLRDRPSVIFHLAGGRAGALSEMIGSNVLTTTNLLETVLSIADYHPRVIVAGSAAEYGDAFGARPLSERAKPHPVAPYGQAKLMQTHAALDFCRRGADVVVARIFNIIGSGTPEHLAAGKFARDIVAREKKSATPIKTADLSGVRDFLDVRDICRALVVLASKGKSGEIYHVSSGQGIVMRDLLKQMIKLSNNPSITFIEDKAIKPGVTYAVGSSAKLRKLGWRPKCDLRQSLREALKSYRKNRRIIL